MVSSQGLNVNRNANSSSSPNKNRKLGAPAAQYSEQLGQSFQGDGNSSSKRLIDRQDSVGANVQAVDKSQSSAKNQKLSDQTV